MFSSLWQSTFLSVETSGICYHEQLFPFKTYLINQADLWFNAIWIMTYRITQYCRLQLIQPQACSSPFIGTLLIHLYFLFICTHLNGIEVSEKFTNKKEITRHFCSNSKNICSSIFIVCSGMNMCKQTLPKWLFLFKNYESENLLKCQVDSTNKWSNYILDVFYVHKIKPKGGL